MTYLFSDIEGSTRLWETDPDRIGPALARHDALAREIVLRHGGRVVKMTGDGLHAAFDDASAALQAVVEIQSAVALPPDGMLPLAVRCGLHAGIDQQRDGDYYGQAVNRAARVMQAAHGGQILLSQAVAERSAGRLPAGCALRDLGQVRLRDLTMPERVYQLQHPQLRSEFPPLRSLASTPNNLPQQVNAFIGRERELDEVRTLLSMPNVRLLTLLGMGGLGKSRLSLQVAAEVIDEYPDGVWFVELAPITDPRSVPQALASLLGVKEDAAGSLQDALLRYLRDKNALIVLDNCEHLVQACADLARQVLQFAPTVKLLASSRDALQTAGETVVHVQPLAAPDAGATITPAALAQIDAVRLFIDRATAVQPALRVTDKNAAAVAAICRRLDGIPLALELAAARTRALSVDAIAARLDDRFKLLVNGERTVLPRQRTLRALIDWSYELLTVPERTLFARLSVFAGGWTLEAAEQVGAGGEIEPFDVLDLLANLVQKSLVSLDVDGDRYRMLETVREYAAGKLEEAPDAAQVRGRHLDFYLALVEEARPHLVGPEQAHWLARLGLERQNVHAAHAWCDHAPFGAQAGLRLSSALRIYWVTQGLLDEGLRFALTALARRGPEVTDLNRGRTLFDAGQLSYESGCYAEAQDLLQQSLALFRHIGDRAREVVVLQLLGLARAGLGDLAAARQGGEEAVAIARQQPNQHALGISLGNLAQIKRAAGDLAGARQLCDEALPICERHGDHLSVASVLFNCAMIAVAQNDPATAIAQARRAADVALPLKASLAEQSLLFVAASVAAMLDDWPEAIEMLTAADEHAQALGLRRDPADHMFVAELTARIATRVPAEALAAARRRAAMENPGSLVVRAAQWLSRANTA